MTNNTLSSGARLELLDFYSKKQSKSQGVGEAGFRHPAVGGEDVAENDKRLCAEEVESILPTCDIPDLGVSVKLSLNPSGVMIELC